MHKDDEIANEPALVSTRTMDIVAAVLFLLVSGIVLYDSLRLGFGWLEGEGPAPGYFPFYLGLILAIASVINMVRAVLRVDPGSEGIFVSAPAFGRVLTVLVPALLYVALIGGIPFGWTTTIGEVEVPIGIPRLGMYVSSAIFIFMFMVVVGREAFLKSLGVAIIVPVALFLLFEKWFLVPLPKGPLEAMLGY
jgi:putative tricarboxylic transport membrane protein